MFKIDKSSIHGLGCFANEFIKKNTKIFDYIGDEMSERGFREKYGEYNKNSLNTYRMRRIHKIIVAKEEPYKTENIVNYINESISPNCILKKRALYALRDIKKDEELFLSYPNNYFRTYDLLHSA